MFHLQITHLHFIEPYFSVEYTENGKKNINCYEEVEILHCKVKDIDMNFDLVKGDYYGKCYISYKNDKRIKACQQN